MGAESRFLHEVGDTLRLHIDSPAETVVDRFAGAFSSVYVTNSNDPIVPLTVLKTPRADVGFDDNVLQVFANEAAVWAGLPRHPNIVQMHGVYRYNGRPYLRIDYVKPLPQFAGGSSVASLLGALKPSGGVASGFAIVFLSQLLSVLRDLEKEAPDFCHCDIKPANILIAEDPGSDNGLRFALTDFGLARAQLVNRSRAPFLGDSRYLAPEVRAGESPGRASDIYSFGCTAFEVCFGVLPASLQRQSAPVALKGPDLPKGCYDLIAGCIQREPHARPHSFDGLRREFLAMLSAAGYSFVEREKRPPPGPAFSHRLASEAPLIPYLVKNRSMTPEHAEDIVMALSDASKLRSAGSFADAEQALAPILEELPDFAPALAGNAHGLFERRKLPGAAALYSRALDGYLSDEDLRRADGDRVASTCASFAQILANNPASPTGHVEYALQLSQLALIYTPNEPRALETRGIVQLRLGRFDEAVASLLRAHEQDGGGNRTILMTLVMAKVLAGRDQLEDLAGVYGLSDSELRSVARHLKGLE